MEPLLFLCHRLPYPPNKGDKLRSFHLLKHFADRYRVHLGTFIDHPDDRSYVDEVRQYCADLFAIEINPLLSRLRSLVGIPRGEALTEAYYRNSSMMSWVDRTIRDQCILKVLVFSSAMGQYVIGRRGLHIVTDFVDVDSAKWLHYSETYRWPISMLYRREAKRLLSFERRLSSESNASVFVTQKETDLFLRYAPEALENAIPISNGVDTEYFNANEEQISPFDVHEEAIVFTGAMDYPPNIDAVCWFSALVLPQLFALRPEVRFYIVGMNPASSVRRLATDNRTVVTGRVPDVRPYLQHARVIVAPLRIARGVQNKILEAMAMGKAVVASKVTVESTSATPSVEIEVADTPEEYVKLIVSLFDPTRASMMGTRARARVLRDYNWSRNLARFDQLLGGGSGAPSGDGTHGALVAQGPCMIG